MSRLEKVKRHNKNVMDAVNILSSNDNISYTYNRRRGYGRFYSLKKVKENMSDYLYYRYESSEVNDKDKLLEKFCYVTKISEIVHLKKALVNFYNELSYFYNQHTSYAKIGITMLDREKKMVADAPRILRQTEKQIEKLNEFVNTKDADYEKSVEIYEQYKKYKSDLNAKISYVVQETQTEHYTDYESRSRMIYDIVLRMPRTEFYSEPVHKTRTVTRDVTKYRPDEKKIEAAKIALSKLEDEVAKIPTYDKNVKIYDSYKTIDELKEKIKEINKQLEDTKTVQSKMVHQIESDLNIAKKLQEVLNREKEIIDCFVKNSNKYRLKDVLELPEREL